MKQFWLGFILFLFLNPLNALDWSRNQVWKIHAVNMLNGFYLEDFESVVIESNWVRTESNDTGWMETEDISLGENYVSDNAFVNMIRTESNSYVRMILKDADTDETLNEKIFFRSGRMDLQNIFNKKVKLVLEMNGPDLKVYSFGLVRKPEVVMTSQEVIVLPDLLFYREESLKIDFHLHFPSVMDVILFDRQGKIIDYIAQNAFFREGENTLFWEPESSSSVQLISGAHVVYFHVRSVDGKTVEVTKPFEFVHH